MAAQSCENHSASNQKLEEPALIIFSEITEGVNMMTGRPEIDCWHIVYGDTTTGPASVLVVIQDSAGVRTDSEWMLPKAVLAELVSDIEDVGLLNIRSEDVIQRKRMDYKGNKSLSVRIGQRSWGYKEREHEGHPSLATEATFLEKRIFDSATSLMEEAFKRATFVRDLSEEQSRTLLVSKVAMQFMLNRKNFKWPSVQPLQ